MHGKVDIWTKNRRVSAAKTVAERAGRAVFENVDVSSILLENDPCPYSRILVCTIKYILKKSETPSALLNKLFLEYPKPRLHYKIYF